MRMDFPAWHLLEDANHAGLSSRRLYGTLDSVTGSSCISTKTMRKTQGS